MSRQIDERVVSMEFDNKSFERNAQTSMNTIDQLNKKLDMTGAAKGLENIGAAANKVDFSGMSAGISIVQSKFSYMQMSIQHQINRIVDSATAAGKKLVSAFTIDPIKTGLQEYETKINAVQTIQANTRGKNTMDDITKALDDLNVYADKTIYNFAQMTSNIGKFTAQGLDVYDSANAVKGMANLAAASGASAEDMSRATYQMSQALGGTIRLMDWNSLRNANMATVELKNTLMDLARVNGVAIDDMVAKHGTFEQTLSEGWLSGEMFTQAMNIYSGVYSDAELASMGFNDAQIKNFKELAAMAESAATDVKTFTQLVDVLKETAQSGWTQTWEIIIGDFETAKKLWGSIYKVIGDALNNSAEARNKILQGWADGGGRAAAIEGIVNIFHGLVDIVKPIKEAFTDIFPPITAKRLIEITERFRDLTAKFKLNDEQTQSLKSAFRGLFALLDIGWIAIKAVVKGVGKLLSGLSGLGGGLLKATGSFGEWLVNLRDAIKESDAFGKIVNVIVKILHTAITVIASAVKVIVAVVKTIVGAVVAVYNFVKNLGVVQAIVSSLSGRFTQLTGNVKGFIGKIKEFFEALRGKIQANGLEGLINLFKVLWETAKKVGGVVLGLLSKLGNALAEAFHNGDISEGMDILNSGIFAAILLGIKKFLGGITGSFDETKGIIKNVSKGIKDILDSVRGCFEAYQQNIKADVLKKIAIAIAILAGSLLVLSLIDGVKLATSLAAVGAMLVGLMLAMKSFSKMGGTHGDGLQGFVKSMLEIKRLNAVAGIMTKLATAVLILSVSMKILSGLSWQQILISGGAIVALIFSLVGAVKLLSSGNGAMVKGCGQMILLAAAVGILAIAMKSFAKFQWDEIGRGLVAMAGAMAILVAAAFGLSYAMPGMIAGGIGMIAMSAGLVVLAGALKLFSMLSWDEIGRGLVAMGGALLVVSAGLYAMSFAMAGALVLPIVAVGLTVLGAAMHIFGNLQLDEIGRGLVALGGALLVIAVGVTAMIAALPGAVALVVVAGALAILAPILVLLGNLSWSVIGTGLLAMAAAFAVLGIAGLVLAPVIPALLGLAVAVGLLGLACVGIGVGLMAFAAGLTTLAAVSAVQAVAIVKTMEIVVTGLLGLVPAIVTAIGQAIIEFCAVIIEAAPAIGAAVTVVALELIKVLVAVTPPLIEAVLHILVVLLEKLAEYTPKIVNAVVDILVALLAALRDRVGDIANVVVEALLAVLEAIYEAVPKFVEGALNIATEFMRSMTETLKEKIPEFLESIEELLTTLGEQAIEFGETGVDIAINFINGLADSLDKNAPRVKEAIDNLCDSILNAILTFFGIHSPSTVFADIGKNLIQGLINGIKGMFGSASSTVKSLASNLVQSVASKASQFATKGREFMTKLRDGISNKISSVKSKAKEAASKAVEGLKSKLESFKTAGKNLIEGFKEGLSSKLSSIKEAAKKVGTTASDTVKKWLGINSPSKVFMEIGKFVDMGFAKGLDKYSSLVSDATSGIGDGAITNMANIVSRIQDFINSDMDSQPTIRPVLDLSAVRNGAGTINGLFGMTPSVDLLSNVGTISSMMNSQNGGNDDVVTAINKLRKDMGKMFRGDNYNINGVTANGDAELENAVKTIVRVSKIERRR